MTKLNMFSSPARLAEKWDNGDPLGDLFDENTPAKPEVPSSRVPVDFKPATERMFEEPCVKCNGTGRWCRGNYVAKCFGCNGTGKKTFKTSPETRQQMRSYAATRRKTEHTQGNIDTFKTAHPAEYEWIKSTTNFPFAAAMRDALTKYGDLTEKQLLAVQRCVTARELNAIKREQKVTTAPTVDVSQIEQAFAKASSSGIRYPKLRLAGFVFSPAGANSKNPGAVYVKEKFSGNYMGKITNGKFLCVAACGPERETQIVTLARDPKNAAIAYGKEFGQCAICGRELSDPKSVELGIGPVCMVKYGW